MERQAFLIGLSGGSASGKTTVAESILEGLGYKDRPGACAIVSMDSFYREFDEEERKMAFHNNFNFDGPKAFDFELLKETLEKMTQGHEVSIPVYNFATHSREKNARQLIAPVKVIIFEGILAFYDRDVVDMCDLKIFVDTDPDIRLVRRLKRDISERGRDIKGVITQYERFVKPSYEQFIEPTRDYADIIVPRGGQNFVAINLIVQHLKLRITSTPLPLADHYSNYRTSDETSNGVVNGCDPHDAAPSFQPPIGSKVRNASDRKRNGFIAHRHDSSIPTTNGCYAQSPDALQKVAAT